MKKFNGLGFCIRNKIYNQLNLSPVSLTPVKSLLPVSTTPVMNTKLWISPRIFVGFSGAREKLIHEKSLNMKFSCQTPFNTHPSLLMDISASISLPSFTSLKVVICWFLRGSLRAGWTRSLQQTPQVRGHADFRNTVILGPPPSIQHNVQIILLKHKKQFNLSLTFI
jgi:hypothetical protein